QCRSVVGWDAQLLPQIFHAFYLVLRPVDRLRCRSSGDRSWGCWLRLWSSGLRRRSGLSRCAGHRCRRCVARHRHRANSLVLVLVVLVLVIQLKADAKERSALLEGIGGSRLKSRLLLIGTAQEHLGAPLTHCTDTRNDKHAQHVGDRRLRLQYGRARIQRRRQLRLAVHALNLLHIVALNVTERLAAAGAVYLHHRVTIALLIAHHQLATVARLNVAVQHQKREAAARCLSQKLDDPVALDVLKLGASRALTSFDPLRRQLLGDLVAPTLGLCRLHDRQSFSNAQKRLRSDRLLSHVISSFCLELPSLYYVDPHQHRRMECSLRKTGGGQWKAPASFP